jgi:hypothetical protein
LNPPNDSNDGSVDDDTDDSDDVSDDDFDDGDYVDRDDGSGDGSDLETKKTQNNMPTTPNRNRES